jgi:predicted porin
MRKQMTAFVASAAFAVPAFAQSGVTLYGVIDECGARLLHGQRHAGKPFF